MKGLILGSLSVLAMSVASVPVAEAFTSVNNSRISGAGYMNHSLNFQVERGNLIGLNITLPEQVRDLDEVQIFYQTGEMIAAETDINDGLVSINFDRPVAPGNKLTLKFKGVNGRYLPGDSLSYRVSAQKEGLSQPIPLRSATVRIPDRD